jgi:hypothetical protein
MDSLRTRIKDFKSRILSADDLSKLSQEEFIAAKTEQLKEAAMKEAQEEMARERRRLQILAEQVEGRLKEAVKFESEIDKLPEAVDPDDYISFRASKDQVTTAERGLLWWEKLGLTGDPFPTKLGLSRIPREKYEDIVVQTEVFRNYLEILSRRPKACLGKPFSSLDNSALARRLSSNSFRIKPSPTRFCLSWQFWILSTTPISFARV